MKLTLNIIVVYAAILLTSIALVACNADSTEPEVKEVLPVTDVLLSSIVPNAIDEVGGDTYYTIWDKDDSFCVVVAGYDEEALNTYVAEMKDYGYSENAQKTSLYGVTEYTVDNINGYTTLEVYTVDTTAEGWANTLNVDEDYFASMSNVARINIETTSEGNTYMMGGN